MAKSEEHRATSQGLGRLHMRKLRPMGALLVPSRAMSPQRPLGPETSPANLLQGPAQVENMGPSSQLADGIPEGPHRPSSQGHTTWSSIPNGSLRLDVQALPRKGAPGRTGMGPSAAVTHPVISWTFIHFPLNYVLLKMVLFSFLTGSCLLMPSLCPR